MASEIPDELIELHRRYNRHSESCWRQFADHRVVLTDLARQAAGPPGPGKRLAVLGAGNCNDLDLKALAECYAEIHLVDVDAQALVRAQERQTPAVREKLVLRAPVDLSGGLDRLPDLRHERPTLAQIAALAVNAADQVTLAVRGTYDTVMSTCLLSQIMHGVRLALGEHPDLEAIAAALALGHLRSLVRLVRPGGTGIFASDTCSSEMYPALEERYRKFAPLAVLTRLEETGTLLAGTQPSTIFEALTADPICAPALLPPRLVEPWLWHMGQLVLLVYAVVFQKREN